MHVNSHFLLAALDGNLEHEHIVNTNGFAFLHSVTRCSALPRDTVTRILMDAVFMDSRGTLVALVRERGV